MTVLIHFPIDRVAPTGGPAGYLCNLKRGLEEVGATSFEFLPHAGEQIEKNAFLRKAVPNRLKELRRLHNLLALPSKNLPAPVDYSRYEAIHFHSTEDLYIHRGALESYDGKVVLTSHSPCAYHKELISRLNPADAERHADELEELSVIDDYAFRNANVVMFPCAEAEEPYFHTWPGYAAARDESKMRYLPTGIAPCTAKAGRSEVRAHYGIPEEAFLMCYVGRHNQIKGYDSLVEMALPILADRDVWMLVAGKEGPLFAPRHEHWVEAGWTDDPHSLIAASDVFVLPNKETYFDLVLLEVLSLGTPVVATRTGGNRYFERLGSSGIFLFEDVAGFSNHVFEVRQAGSEGRDCMRAANRSLFKERFTCREFARNYALVFDMITGGGV